MKQERLENVRSKSSSQVEARRACRVSRIVCQVRDGKCEYAIGGYRKQLSSYKTIAEEKTYGRIVPVFGD